MLAGKMKCPCNKCKNGTWLIDENVELHLYQHGILEHYKVWYEHDEKKEAPKKT